MSLPAGPGRFAMLAWPIALALVLLSATAVAAHPFHTSLGEVEWNGKTRRLEVSLRVDAGDFERALRHMTHRAVVLEQLADLDELAAKYVGKSLEFHTPAGKKLAIKWVGSELETRFVWLYFEVIVPDQVDEVRIRNELLCEVDPSQINMVVFRCGRRRTGARFDRQRTAAAITLPTMRVAMGNGAGRRGPVSGGEVNSPRAPSSDAPGGSS